MTENNAVPTPPENPIKYPIQTTFKAWTRLARKIGNSIPDFVFFKIGVESIDQERIRLVYSFNGGVVRAEFYVEMLLKEPDKMRELILGHVTWHLQRYSEEQVEITAVVFKEE